MYVYYWHVLVGMMMGSICSRIHIPEILYSNVITVFLASCLFGYVIFIVKRKFMVQKVRRQKEEEKDGCEKSESTYYEKQ